MTTKSKAPAKKPTRKVGRPKLQIDAGMVEKLAGIGCPNTEIAAIIGCSVATLDRHFVDVIHKGRENLKTRLRKKQVEVALSGNIAMLIWLGKQMLAQSEKVENKTEITGGVTSNLSEADAKAVKEWAKEIRAKVRKESKEKS